MSMLILISRAYTFGLEVVVVLIVTTLFTLMVLDISVREFTRTDMYLPFLMCVIKR